MRPESGFQIAPKWPKMLKMAMASQSSDITSSSIFLTFFVSIVKFSYWSKFHVNIITGSEVMSISFYKGFTRMRAHVHLVCDIYCAYAYFCGCDSTIFCFRKLKSRRLIFLINLSVQFNNKHRKPSKKDEKRMINHANKENVFFYSKLSPG